jgi:hypothetical protein
MNDQKERAQLSDEWFIETAKQFRTYDDYGDWAVKLVPFARAVIAADRATAPVSAPVEEPVATDDPEVDPVKALCYYADSMCGILRQHGYPGKAEALESRIRVVMDATGAKTSSAPIKRAGRIVTDPNEAARLLAARPAADNAPQAPGTE